MNLPRLFYASSIEKPVHSCQGCLAFCRELVARYKIKYFYDITDLSNFKANPDYKGVCHIALAQEGHCKPGDRRKL